MFGNLLNSLLALDTQPLLHSQKSRPDQYHADFILQELNKAYSGFHCQQDRGDISTELLALTVKRGSVAFVAEDYPECGAPFRITSRQSDLGNIPAGVAEQSLRMPAVPPPATMFEPSGTTSPLSPIPEISESTNFSAFLADDIIQAGLKQVEGASRRAAKQPERGAEEEAASKIINAIFEHPSELFGEGSESTHSGIGLTPSMDNLATAIASSILKASTHSASAESRPVGVRSQSTADLDKSCSSIARSIIADVLTSSPPPPPPPSIATPQTVGESSSSSSVEGLSSMAAGMSGSILSDVLEKYLGPVQQSPITIQLDGKDRRISSLTASNPCMALCEYINEVTNKAIHEGISVAQVSGTAPQTNSNTDPNAVPKTDPKAWDPNAVPKADPCPDRGLVEVAEALVSQSIQNGLKRVQPRVQERKEPSSLPSLRKQPRVEEELPLGTPPRAAAPLAPSLANGSPDEPLQATLPGDQKPQDPPIPREPADLDGDTQSSTNFNSRLLTPMSSRAGGYAWSIASTRDEDSRPVSPTDLNKLGLSLSNNADEFSSLFSDIVINNAITNITGENVSPQAISAEGQDHTSLPSSSKIGIFLSKLGEAETPSDPGMTTWQNMRRKLLRPITTGTWRCGGVGGAKGDPQLMAMIQWMAASASGRPRLFLYSRKEEDMQQVSCWWVRGIKLNNGHIRPRKILERLNPNWGMEGFCCRCWHVRCIRLIMVLET